jgi:hypothetical protein
MKPIKPNDLGDSRVVEWSRKININDFVRQAIKQLKQKLIESQIEVCGQPIKLTTSKTRYGERYWFVCTECSKRVGILFEIHNHIGCRRCCGLKYQKQRYEGLM